MSYPRIETIALTGSSSVTVTSFSNVITGEVRTLSYTRSTLSTATSLTITTEDTSQSVLVEQINADAVRSPRLVAHTVAGVALDFGTTGGDNQMDYISIVNERIKVVVTGGSTTGAVTAGSITVIYG